MVSSNLKICHFVYYLYIVIVNKMTCFTFHYITTSILLSPFINMYGNGKQNDVFLYFNVTLFLFFTVYRYSKQSDLFLYFNLSLYVVTIKGVTCFYISIFIELLQSDGLFNQIVMIGNSSMLWVLFISGVVCQLLVEIVLIKCWTTTSIRISVHRGI